MKCQDAVLDTRYGAVLGAAGAGAGDELERLRRENAQLKRDNKEPAMERDVPKHCMVLWVKQPWRTCPKWSG